VRTLLKLDMKMLQKRHHNMGLVTIAAISPMNKATYMSFV